MSVIRNSFSWLMLVALVTGGSFVSAQGFHPFAEPLEFDPDFQLFAPLHLQDVQELDARQRANTGWYGTYDRMYVFLNRSDSEQDPSRLDSSWGNRFDFGYRSKDGSGWAFSTFRIGGPNAYNLTFQNRLNIFDATDFPIDNNNRVFPRSFRNDQQFAERVYILRDSLNVANFSNFEVSKTWRLKPYRNGGILEPLVGLRFSGLADYAVNDTYTLPGQPTAAVLGGSENLNEQIVRTRNTMVLGQLGWHYQRHTNRWRLSNDFKVFAGQNFQSQSTTIRDTLTFYNLTNAEVAIGTQPVLPDSVTTTFSGQNNSEFVVGFDVRLESAYQVSKGFAVRGGLGLLYIGRGVWRGSTPIEAPTAGFGGLDATTLQQQDLIIPSATFGITFNR